MKAVSFWVYAVEKSPAVVSLEQGPGQTQTLGFALGLDLGLEGSERLGCWGGGSRS